MVRQASILAVLAGVAVAASASPFVAAKAKRPAGVVNNDLVQVTSISDRTDGNFTFTLTLTQDVDSFGDQGSVLNNIISLDLNDLAGTPAGSPASIQKLGISADLEAFDPSWLSELDLWFIDSSFDTNTAIIGTPAVGTDNPGSGLFDLPLTDLTDVLLADIPLADGVLNLEFAEGFDDPSVEPDGVWRAGSTITIEATVVPAPTSAALLGLGGLVTSRRRR